MNEFYVDINISNVLKLLSFIRNMYNCIYLIMIQAAPNVLGREAKRV